MTKVRRKRRCKECKELFTPRYSTAQMVCSPSCAYSYSKKKDKQTKEKNNKELAKLEKEKKEYQKLGALLKSVENVCHKYIRLRDKGKPCISCGTPYKSDFDAGHYYSAGTYSNIKFDENNIHGQCIQCNRFNEGNLNEYSINLPKRIGGTKYDVLKAKASMYKKIDFKWNRDALKEVREYYKQKLKEL